MGPTANTQNPKGAPLLSHREFTKPQGCTIGVPPRIHKTPRLYHWTPIVHPCGFVISRWDPYGAPLGFREFAVGPAQLGSHRELTKPQGCTIGVPLRIKKTPRVHNWDPNREFTKPLWCTIGFPPRIHKTPRLHHWGPTANSQNRMDAPLGSHREFTNPQGAPLGSHCELRKPQGCTIGVPLRIKKTPRVHNWDPKREFTKPQGCTIGVPPRIHKLQGCTIWVPPRHQKTPRMHHWGSTAN